MLVEACDTQLPTSGAFLPGGLPQGVTAFLTPIQHQSTHEDLTHQPLHTSRRMVESITTLVLFFGVVLGSGTAGVIANGLNELSDADPVFHRTILAVYVTACSLGLTAEYGRPVLITIAAYLGVVTLGGAVVGRMVQTNSLDGL